MLKNINTIIITTFCSSAYWRQDCAATRHKALNSEQWTICIMVHIMYIAMHITLRCILNWNSQCILYCSAYYCILLWTAHCAVYITLYCILKCNAYYIVLHIEVQCILHWSPVESRGNKRGDRQGWLGRQWQLLAAALNRHQTSLGAWGPCNKCNMHVPEDEIRSDPPS